MGYFTTLEKKDCCACSACVHSCPVQAIRFEKDEEGFDYPNIDESKCIHCGLCEKVCPVSHPQYDNSIEPDVYAALLKNVEERKRSSSGGLFYAIASWVIAQGGVVFGACINEQNQVMHISADNEQDLQKLRGSKYVQSALNDIFKQVKENLQADRWCYFVGTGCQVAGLKSYLRKEYDKLITSDLVCHGVPSQWLFDQHVAYLEKKYRGKVTNYKFRNNEIGGGCEIFNLTNHKGKVKTVINPSYNLSPYLYSFMYAMTYRYSCYDCKFATVPRQGDITLADYWGSKEFFPQMDNSKGISLCLVNTEQGKRVWNAIKTKCEYEVSNVDDAAKYNGNLVKASIAHPCRPTIYNNIKNNGYEIVAKNEFRIKNYYKVRFFSWISHSPLLMSLIKILTKSKHFC